MRAIKTISISILAVGLLAGSTVGVAAQDDTRPVVFSWTFGGGESESIPGTMDESMPDMMTMRDFIDIGPIVADDERASGRLTSAFNADFWGDDNANAPETFSATTASQRLVNDGGSWSGNLTGVDHDSGGDSGVRSGMTMSTLTGEDGYEGLTLILVLEAGADGGTGFIFPSVLPVPELPAAAANEAAGRLTAEAAKTPQAAEAA